MAETPGHCLSPSMSIHHWLVLTACGLSYNLDCKPHSLQFRFGLRYIASGRTAQKTSIPTVLFIVACFFSNNSYTVTSVFVSAATFLQCRYVAMDGCLGYCSLAMGVSPRSTILAFSHRVKILRAVALCSVCSLYAACAP
jgi:hypothetical protein